jgi:hypothetical protein
MYHRRRMTTRTQGCAGTRAVFVSAFSILTALIAASLSASAQTVNLEIEAAPIAATRPAPGAPLTIMIAPIDDAIGAFSDATDRELLDATFADAIGGQPGAAYSTVRLALPGGPCDLRCRTASARRDGAAYLVSAELRKFAGAYIISINVIRASDDTAVRALQSAAVAAPSDLLAAAKRVAAEVAAAIAQAEGLPSSQPVTAAAAPTWTGTATHPGAATRTTPISGLPGVDAYRSSRNSGVAMFVIGIIVQGVGGGLLGAGGAIGSDELFWSGIGVVAFGDVLFWAGLAVWVTNQVRMNKVERGIPLGRSLRLEGLAPVVASQGRGAPGLSAQWSF